MLKLKGWLVYAESFGAKYGTSFHKTATEGQSDLNALKDMLPAAAMVECDIVPMETSSVAVICGPDDTGQLLHIRDNHLHLKRSEAFLLNSSANNHLGGSRADIIIKNENYILLESLQDVDIYSMIYPQMQKYKDWFVWEE